VAYDWNLGVNNRGTGESLARHKASTSMTSRRRYIPWQGDCQEKCPHDARSAAKTCKMTDMN
jgi:hypothetical protein